MAQVTTKSSSVDVVNDPEAFYALAEEEGWGDGHPLIPPTQERVERFLSQGDLDPDTVIAVLPPGRSMATVEKIAINAVMAGCKPEYMDVVLTAIRLLAMGGEGGWLGHVMTTAHSRSPLLVINGPIARDLGITTGADGSAVSWRANAAICRAVRLTLINIAGIRGVTDGNTFGWLPKYMYAIAEDEAATPWESFSVEKGFTPNDDVLTVFWSEPARHLDVNWAVTVPQLLALFCDAMQLAACYQGGGLLGLSPRHARACALAGFSKADVKRFIFEHARKPLKAYGGDIVSHFNDPEWRKFYSHSPDAMVPMVSSPDENNVVVFGGSGPESLFFNGTTGTLTTPLRIGKIERHYSSPRSK